MATDNFTNSDGTGLESHDSNWGNVDATYVVTNFEINSNLCEPEGDFQNCGARYTTSTEDLSQIVIKGGSYNQNTKRVVVRCNGTHGGYAAAPANFSGDTIQGINLYKNHVFLDSASGLSYNRTSDLTFKITASGTSTTTVKGFINGTEEVTTDDSTSPYTSGNPGFMSVNTLTAANAQFDDWTDGASAGSNVSPEVGTLLFKGNEPSAGGAAHVPELGVLTLKGNEVSVTSISDVSPEQGKLIFKGYEPVLTNVIDTVLPETGKLIFKGYEPTDLNQKDFYPTESALELVGNEPDTVKGITVSPDVGMLEFVGQEILTSAGNQTTKQPEKGLLILKGYEPEANQATVSKSPEVGKLTYLGQEPVLFTGTVQTPDQGKLIFKGYEPDAGSTQSDVSPDVGQLIFKGNEPAKTAIKLSIPSKGVIRFVGAEPNARSGVQTITDIVSGKLIFNGAAPDVVTGFWVEVPKAAANGWTPVAKAR